jgi:hypothetical protein
MSDDERTPCPEDGCSLLAGHKGDFHVGPEQEDGARIIWTMEHSAKKVADAFGYYYNSGIWAVADQDGWVTGYFDTEETALAAVSVNAGPLRKAYAEMQRRVNWFDAEDRPITMADLESLEDG